MTTIGRRGTVRTPILTAPLEKYATHPTLSGRDFSHMPFGVQCITMVVTPPTRFRRTVLDMVTLYVVGEKAASVGGARWSFIKNRWRVHLVDSDGVDLSWIPQASRTAFLNQVRRQLEEQTGLIPMGLTWDLVMEGGIYGKTAV